MSFRNERSLAQGIVDLALHWGSAESVGHVAEALGFLVVDGANAARLGSLITVPRGAGERGREAALASAIAEAALDWAEAPLDSQAVADGIIAIVRSRALISACCAEVASSLARMPVA